MAKHSGGSVTALDVVDIDRDLSDVSANIANEVVEGNPAEEILKMAGGMNLVVMGSVGRTGLSKFLLGSATEKVVRNSKAPVMVVY